MLADKWDGKQDVTGWHISEKLDGLRALWTGGRFVSRAGNAFPCPDWFKALLPEDETLDGELWCGRQQFQQAVSIVRNTKRGDDWRFVTFMVFDAPKAEGGFEARMDHVRSVLASCKVAQAVGSIPCESTEHLQAQLRAVEGKGGEGLMLRRPESQYEGKRSKALLKVKSFCDEEAEVMGHQPGDGKHAGRMGALLCRTPDGREFKVGTGFSDAQRSKPPRKGAVVTYKYFELTADNIPRFPTFVGERVDISWADYCTTYSPPDQKKATELKRANSLMYTEKREDAPVDEHAGSDRQKGESPPRKKRASPKA